MRKLGTLLIYKSQRDARLRTFWDKLVDIIIQCKIPTSFEKVILFSIDRKIKKIKKERD